MADSNAETILMLTGISGCTDDDARRWLKVKNNDADAALNAILDNEDLGKAEVCYLSFTAQDCHNCSYRNADRLPGWSDVWRDYLLCLYGCISGSEKNNASL
jgi:hypothetical protein